MTRLSHQSLLAFVLLLLLGLVIGGSVMVDTAAATPQKTTSSIGKRVADQSAGCTSVGGSIDVAYSYEDGKLVSAQTACTIGTTTTVCVNDKTSMDCYEVKHKPTSPVDSNHGDPFPVIEAGPATTLPGHPIEEAPVVGADANQQVGNVTPAGDEWVPANPVVEGPTTSPVDSPMPMLVPLN